MNYGVGGFMKISNEELRAISGGGFGFWAGIGAFISFVISIVDGFINPKACE